jgi:phage N-6-adenine-methyltransferase
MVSFSTSPSDCVRTAVASASTTPSHRSAAVRTVAAVTKNPGPLRQNQSQLTPAGGVFGRAIRDARAAASLSMEQLAFEAGLTKGAVAQVERGGGRLDTLLGLAKRLGLRLVGRNLPDGDSLGRQLAALRKIRGYSQRGAARQSGATLPTVAEIERGNPRVHLAGVVKLAALLNAPLSLEPVNKAPAPYYASSEIDHWTTPRDFALLLAKAVGGQFDLDAASPGPELSPIPARHHYTAAINGLAQEWHAPNAAWLNPPYGQAKGGAGIVDWLDKVVTEVDSGRARMVVGLLRNSSGSLWWRDYIRNTGAHVYYITGRLKFGDGKSKANFDSVVVVWGGAVEDHQRIDAALAEWEAREEAAKKTRRSGKRRMAVGIAPAIGGQHVGDLGNDGRLPVPSVR